MRVQENHKDVYEKKIGENKVDLKIDFFVHISILKGWVKLFDLEFHVKLLLSNIKYKRPLISYFGFHNNKCKFSTG